MKAISSLIYNSFCLLTAIPLFCLILIEKLVVVIELIALLIVFLIIHNSV